MPGIAFANQQGGMLGTPSVGKYLLANSMTGTGTPPANGLNAGDLVVLTTKSTLTSNSNVVVRMLLAADKSAHYKEGTPVAGILGVAASSVQTNASGVAQPGPAAGGITTTASISYPYSEPALWGADPASGRNYLKVDLFLPGNVFIGRLDMAAGAITLQHQYDNTLAGFILNTTTGVTTYTVDTGAAAADQCLRIIGPNTQDPLYNTLVAQNAAVGPSVFFEVLDSFSQALTGVDYSTQ